ncbi:MAG: PAS domain S-box protein, partial [Dehalococcoidia bacterium]
IVPLRARGKSLGAVTFVAAESGRRFDRADLELAADLARRAAWGMSAPQAAQVEAVSGFGEAQAMQNMGRLAHSGSQNMRILSRPPAQSAPTESP